MITVSQECLIRVVTVVTVTYMLHVLIVVLYVVFCFVQFYILSYLYVYDTKTKTD